MIIEQVINKEVVKPIPKTNNNDQIVKGKDLFHLLYANIFICAKKNSGKSTVISKIIKSCILRLSYFVQHT